MSLDKEQMQRLLSLYASGQLAEAERTQLFSAALEDQELFEALAHEDSLRDAFELPGAKERVIEQLAPRKKNQWFAWAGGLAAVTAAVVVMIAVRNPHAPPAEEPTAQVAVQVPQAPPPAPVIEPNVVAPKRVPMPQKQISAVVDKPAVQASSPPPPPQISLEVMKEKAALPTAQQAKAQDVTKRDSISVMAATPLIPSRQNFVAAEDAIMIASTTPAYTVLRRGEDGVFSAIQLNQLLKLGDAIRLSILAQSSGTMTAEYSGRTETLPVTMGSLYTVPRTSQIILDEASGQSVVRIRYSSGAPALEIILKYQ